GGCGPECRRASYCGDGTADPEFEECDDGANNRDETYGVCASNCKLGPRCGDGTIQANEECDGGEDCNASCKRGGCDSGQLRCGDSATCVDPKTNSQFCGASGTCQGDNDGQICAMGSQCSNGECQCPNGGVICDS